MLNPFASPWYHAAMLVSLLAFVPATHADEPTPAITTIVNSDNIDADELIGLIKSLGALEGKSNPAISTLIRLLFDDRHEVRIQTIRALQKSGKLAVGAAAPILSRMWQVDSSLQVRQAAADVLLSFDMRGHFVNGLNPQASRSAEQQRIASRVRREEELNRGRLAGQLIGQFPLSDDDNEFVEFDLVIFPLPLPAPEMPYPLDPLPVTRPLSRQDVANLMAMVNGDVGRLRRSAMRVLHDRAGPRSIPEYVKLTLHAKSRVRGFARNMLWDSGEDGELTAMLAYAIQYRLGNLHIAELVDRIGPQHQLAKQLLVRLYHPRWVESRGKTHDMRATRIHLAVLRAIGRLQLDDDATLHFLVQCRRTESDAIRTEARRVVLSGHLGNRLFHQIMIDRLKDAKQRALSVRVEKSGPTLWSDSRAKPIVRTILVNEHDERVRAFVLTELTMIRPRPIYVAAILQEHWETDKSAWVRRRAISAAADLESEGRTLIRPLAKVATEPGNVQLRLTAVRSLRRIVGEKATVSKSLERLQNSLEIRWQTRNLERLIADAERLRQETNDKRKRDLLRTLRRLDRQP